MKTTTIVIVYFALVLLLGLTLGLASLHGGESWKPAAGLLVATTKAGLIALIFMHILYQKGLVRIFASAGLFWLLLLFILTFSDYLTRQWL